MIDGLRVLGLVTARGGSKGVPRKNVREVAGRPLIAWTVAAGRGARHLDRLVLSSEDAEIMAAARAAGCEVPFVRPTALAADDTPGIEPVLHALRELPGFDLVVLLQPTSPLRTAADIDACIELCAGSGAPAAVSVCPPAKSPWWMYTRDEAQRLAPLLPRPAGLDAERARRQDLPPVFALNGAVYVARVPWLLHSRSFLSPDTRGHVMPASRSLDIDDEDDLALADLALRRAAATAAAPGQGGPP